MAGVTTRLFKTVQWSEYERAIAMIIIALGLILRLYGIGLPFLDSHAERQTLVAMTARNLYQDQMNILCTRLDILGNGSECTIFEFPIVHGLAALLYFVFGEHEIIGRLLSVAFSIGAMFVMYGLARQFLTPLPALAGLSLYVLSPMNIYFSRTFMAESSLMFFTIAAVYFLLRWLERPSQGLYLVSVTCAALAFLAKPTAVLLLGPLLTCWFVKYRWISMRRADFWLYLFLILTPMTLWTLHANYVNAQHPNMPISWQWISVITDRGGIFNWWIDPRFYLKIGFSIVFVLLTPVGFIGMVLGAFSVPPERLRPVLYVWLAAVVGYFFILAGANQGHIYYQLPLLPVATIFFGFAVTRVFNWDPSLRLMQNSFFRSLAIVGLLITVIGYGTAYYVFFSYMYDTTLRMPHVPAVAKIIREETPPDGSIIVNQPNAFATVLTYYAERKSWNFVEQSIERLEHLRTRGATTYVAMNTRYGNGVDMMKHNKRLWGHLKEQYTPIALSENYAIYDLRDVRIGVRSSGGR